MCPSLGGGGGDRCSLGNLRASRLQRSRSLCAGRRGRLAAGWRSEEPRRADPPAPHAPAGPARIAAAARGVGTSVWSFRSGSSGCTRRPKAVLEAGAGEGHSASACPARWIRRGWAGTGIGEGGSSGESFQGKTNASFLRRHLHSRLFTGTSVGVCCVCRGEWSAKEDGQVDGEMRKGDAVCRTSGPRTPFCKGQSSSHLLPLPLQTRSVEVSGPYTSLNCTCNWECQDWSAPQSNGALIWKCS